MIVPEAADGHLGDFDKYGFRAPRRLPNRALLIVLECHPMVAGYWHPPLIERCLFGILTSMSCSANYPAAIIMGVSGLFLVSLII